MKKLLLMVLLFGCKPYKTVSIISTDSVGNMITIKVKHYTNIK
jgi:hypothetical protein